MNHDFQLSNMRFFFLFIGLLLLASCTKGTGDFTIYGVITDDTFHIPMQGAQLKLYKIPVASNQKILIETYTLDQDGAFRFTFPRERMEKYILIITKDNYFPLEETIYYSSLNLKQDNERNYSTKAKAWVALRFINSNPIFSDHLQYIKQEGLQGCAECCPNAQQDYYGALDTTIYCINNGNEMYSLYYYILGTSNQGQLSANCVPFDTTEILLNY